MMGMSYTILNKCPVCGGDLYIQRFYQYTVDSKIGKKGLPLKGTRKTKGCSMDSYIISCRVPECFYVNCDLEIESPSGMGYDYHVELGDNDEFLLVKNDPWTKPVWLK